MITIISGIEAGRARIARARSLEDKGGNARTAERVRALFGEDLSPDQAVARILADVAARGEAACLDWTHRIDGIALTRLFITPEEITLGFEETPLAVREALQAAAERIRAFHDSGVRCGSSPSCARKNCRTRRW